MCVLELEQRFTDVGEAIPGVSPMKVRSNDAVSPPGEASAVEHRNQPHVSISSDESVNSTFTWVPVRGGGGAANYSNPSPPPASSSPTSPPEPGC